MHRFYYFSMSMSLCPIHR